MSSADKGWEMRFAVIFAAALAAGCGDPARVKATLSGARAVVAVDGDGATITGEVELLLDAQLAETDVWLYALEASTDMPPGAQHLLEVTLESDGVFPVEVGPDAPRAVPLRFTARSRDLASDELVWLCAHDGGGLWLSGEIYVADSDTFVYVDGAQVALSAGTPGDFALPWAKRFGGELGLTEVHAAAADPAGGVVFTGTMDRLSPVDFGGGALPVGDDDDVYVAALDDAGNHRFSSSFQHAGVQTPSALAATPGGGVLLGGSFEPAVAFGGEVFQSAGLSDVFVTALDASGDPRWARVFGSADVDALLGVAPAPGGGAVLLARFYGEVDLGGGPLLAGPDPGDTLVLAQLDAAGEHLSSRTFPGAAVFESAQLVVDGGGRPLVAGLYYGTIDLGAGPVASSDQLSSPFVAAFSPAHELLWAHTFSGALSPRAIAADGEGGLFLYGELRGPVDLGGGVIGPNGESDLVLARFDAAGALRFAKIYSGGALASGLGVSPAGHVFLSGSFSGSLDFDGIVLSGASTSVTFVAEIDGEGTPLRAQAFGCANARSFVVPSLASQGAFLAAAPIWTTLAAERDEGEGILFVGKLE